ncbi:MAG: leucine-rich repeat domain-containing protein, partial [Anaeroplasmataceae bacterium]|nr:leucine-rich repeat domain-containing protein [Anaeroplasmataceae bacterium]
HEVCNHEYMIGNYAFANNHFERYNEANPSNRLSKVVLAESFETILDHSFANCSYIESIDYETNVTGTYTFANDGVMHLTYLDVTFTKPGEEGINLDDGLFYNSAIKLFDIVDNRSYISRIGNYAFYNCDDFEINENGLVDTQGVRFLTDIEEIGDYAFAYSEHIHGVTLPATLVTVGRHSFEHTAIEKVIFNGATVIGDYMFADNENINELVVTNTVASVGTHAFAYCTKLHDIKYYSSVVGDYMFYNCVNVDENGDNVNNPYGQTMFTFDGSSDQVIGDHTDLPQNHIYIGSDMREIGRFAFALDTVVEKIVIEEGLNGLGAYAFAFSSISEIVIPDSVTEMGEGFLAGCQYMEDITVPHIGSKTGNTETKDSLFGWFFGSFVFTEDEPGFIYESYLEGLSEAETSNVGVANRQDDELEFLDEEQTIVDDRILIHFDYQSMVNEFVIESTAQKASDILTYYFYIPNTLRTINVTQETLLGYGAFYNLYFITEINLPNTQEVIEKTGKAHGTLIQINSYAFYNCYNLTYMEVPNEVRAIQASPFEGCLSLVEMDLPFIGGSSSNNGSSSSVFGFLFGLREFTVTKEDGTTLSAIPTEQYFMKQSDKNIDNYRVYYLPPNLDTVTFHVETVVAYGAFYNCSTLHHIYLPETVIAIEDYAFYACMGLEEMYIPYRVSELKTHVFENCHNIQQITIPGAHPTLPMVRGVRSIGEYTFANCFSLESLVIPNSVEQFGYAVFSGCIALTDLTLPFVGEKARRITDRFFTTTGDETGDELHSGFGWMFGSETPGITEHKINGVDMVIVDPYTKIYLTQYFTYYPLIIDGEEVVLTSNSSEEEFRTALDIFNEKHFLGAYQKTLGTYTDPREPEQRYQTALTYLDLPEDLAEKNADREMFYVTRSIKYITLTNTSMILDESFKDVPSIEEVDVTACTNLCYIGNFAFGNSLQSTDEDGNIINQSQLRIFTQSTDVNLADSDRAVPFADVVGDTDRVIDPDILTYVGHYAFFMNCNLNHFDMPSTVEEIGDYAFYCTESLTYVIIPARVQQNAIGKYSYAESGMTDITILNKQLAEGQFMNCDDLLYICVPELIYGIGKSAFEDCDSLVYITYLDDTISERMFAKCKSLYDVVIPNHVAVIGDYAFADCESITYIHYESDLVGQFMFMNNKNLQHVYHSAAGNLVGFDETGRLISVINSNGDFSYSKAQSYAVDADGKAVCDEFGHVIITETDNHNSQVIGFRDTTIDIGQYAFANCTSLEEVVLPEGEQFDIIMTGAFSGCTTLTEINIPANIVKVGDSAFADCTSVADVNFVSKEDGGHLTEIGSKAFRNLREVEELVVPTTVEHIGEGAFSRLVSLRDLSIPFVGDEGNPKNESTQYNSLFGYIFGYATTENGTNPDEAAADGKHMYPVRQMYGSESEYWVYMPVSLKNVTVYGDIQDQLRYGAFSGCAHLEHVYLCESITKIEDYVFAGCSRLQDMDLTNLVDLLYLGDRAFERCLTIDEILLPMSSPSFTKIGSDAFAYCISLPTLAIPNSIEELGARLFTGCKNLESLELPFIGINRLDTNTETNNSTFAYFFEKNRPNYYADDVTSLGEEEVMGPSCDPNHPEQSQTDTGDYTNFTEVLQHFKDYSYLYNLLDAEDEEEDTTISGWIPKKLKSVTITSESIIAYGAFMNCADIETVTLRNDLYDPESPSTSVAVTEIHDYAFFNMDSLTNVNKVIDPDHVTSDIEILDTVTSIGNYAFAECDSIVNIFTPRSDIEYGTYVFAYSHGLKNLQFRTEAAYRNFPLKSHMFFYCDVLEDLVTPEDIEVIGEVQDYVFAYNLALTNLQYNDDHMGDHMFDTCISLVEVDIKECVTTVDDYVFANCTALTTPRFANEIIGRYMFYNDTALVDVVVSPTIVDIRFAAFENCYNIETMTLPFVGQHKDADQSVFEGDYYNGETKTWEKNPNASDEYEKYIELGVANAVFGWMFGKAAEDEDLEEINSSIISQIFRLPATDEEENAIANFEEFKIPNSIQNINITNDQYIGFGAFSSTKMVNYVFATEDTDETDATVEFGAYAFAYSEITTLNLPEDGMFNINIPESVTLIRDHAFDSCQNIITIRLTTQLTSDSCETYVFTNCDSLVEILFENSYIGEHMFDDCDALVYLTVHSTIDEIEDYAFANCDLLAELDFQNELVGNYMFSNCPSLVTVVIADCVKTVGYAAFEKCPNIETIVLPVVGKEASNDRTEAALFGWIFGFVSENETETKEAVMPNEEAPKNY